MRNFLDANILVSVLNKEYPLFTYTSRIISLADKPKFTLFTSPVCLAIAFYFAEKKYNSISAKNGLDYYSAVESKCDCIITEDIHDFYFSKIEVLNSESFFEKYLFGN